MKPKISIALNIVLFLATLLLTYACVSASIGIYYYHKTVGIVAGGAVVALENGNTNLVHEALSSIRSDPNIDALNEAGQKLGVIGKNR